MCDTQRGNGTLGRSVDGRSGRQLTTAIVVVLAVLWALTAPVSAGQDPGLEIDVTGPEIVEWERAAEYLYRHERPDPLDLASFTTLKFHEAALDVHFFFHVASGRRTDGSSGCGTVDHIRRDVGDYRLDTGLFFRRGDSNVNPAFTELREYYCISDDQLVRFNGTLLYFIVALDAARRGVALPAARELVPADALLGPVGGTVDALAVAERAFNRQHRTLGNPDRQRSVIAGPPCRFAADRAVPTSEIVLSETPPLNHLALADSALLASGTPTASDVWDAFAPVRTLLEDGSCAGDDVFTVAGRLGAAMWSAGRSAFGRDDSNDRDTLALRWLVFAAADNLLPAHQAGLRSLAVSLGAPSGLHDGACIDSSSSAYLDEAAALQSLTDDAQAHIDDPATGAQEAALLGLLQEEAAHVQRVLGSLHAFRCDPDRRDDGEAQARAYSLAYLLAGLTT